MKMWINLFWGKGVARYATTLVLLLAACAPATAEPTETAKVEPSATGTETPEATETMTPSATAAHTATLFLTFTPLPYRTPQGEFINYVGGYSFSPNGKWAAWSLCCSNTGNHMLVEEINGTQVHQKFYDTEEYPWPEAYYRAEGWSPDGRYLYYGVYPVVDGGCGNFSVSGDLQRLNLESGSTAPVLPYEANKLIEFSVSPSGTFVAHSAQVSGLTHVSILNLVNGQEKSIVLDAYEAPFAGRMLWSPEETHLFFEVSTDIPSRCSSVFILLTVDTMVSQEISIDESVDILWPIEWRETNIIIFGAAPDGGSQELELNFDTGELTAYEE